MNKYETSCVSTHNWSPQWGSLKPCRIFLPNWSLFACLPQQNRQQSQLAVPPHCSWSHVVSRSPWPFRTKRTLQPSSGDPSRKRWSRHLKTFEHVTLVKSHSGSVVNCHIILVFKTLVLTCANLLSCSTSTNMPFTSWILHLAGLIIPEDLLPTKHSKTGLATRLSTQTTMHTCKVYQSIELHMQLQP